MLKKVLVTGATGFVGRHALNPLHQCGFEVHAATSRSSFPQGSPYQWHTADLLDPAQVSRLLAAVQPTHLLHFAWYVMPGDYQYSLQNFRWVQTSLEILLRFKENGGQRAVLAGTCFEYDASSGYCSEFLTPRAPNSVYGKCKHALQVMLDGFCSTTGLSSAWGRIFFLYGPHEYPERLISYVIRSLLQGKPALCSNGNQIRDYLYVQDVADAFVALLASDVTGPVNIALGQGVAVKEIISKIAEQMDRIELVRLGARPTAVNEPATIVADVTRLAREVGWTPRYDLDTGLAQTIGWWKAKLCGKNDG